MALATTKSPRDGTFTIAERKTLQLTDIKANSNKFYTIELRNYSGEWSLYTVYGRTGASKTEDYRHGSQAQCQSEYNRLVKNKEKKGYREVETEDTIQQTAPTFNINKGVKGPVYDLVEFMYGFSRNFVRQNVDSPIGKLSVGQIDKAQSLLKQIGDAMIGRKTKPSDAIIDLHNEYYKAVPQKLGRRIEIADVLLKTEKDIAFQEELLQNIKDMVVVKGADTDFDERYRALNAEITVPTKEEIDRIKYYVLNSRSDRHRVKAIDIKDILAISRPADDKRYDRHLAGICEKEAFHGTRNPNLLGICSRGFLLPGQHNASITGAMYGAGIYGALHSTKSMQYCGPGYNDRHTERTNDQFMFIIQMAMGNYQSGRDWSRHHRLLQGKNSTWASSNEDGLLHDELIVYRVEQVRLTHIVRFQTTGTFW